MLKRTIATVFVAALLCLVALPVTALAAAENAPTTLYVGNYRITNGDATTYLKAGSTQGSLVEGSENDWTVKYDPSTATLTLNGATITGNAHISSFSYGAGIYAQSNSGQPVALTIELIGENTITGNFGIYVNAEMSADSYGTDASLNITGNGSLIVTGTNSHGLFVKSGTGNASLTINDASVVAKATQTYSGYAGVNVQSSMYATSSPQLSLKVNGGSLTASSDTSGYGIQFYVGSSQATGATTSLTVTDNAIVRAKNGIKAERVDKPTPSGAGIVFDGGKGTVYGDVTLQENLEIGEGESLTIPDGASLTIPDDKTLTVNGGALTGDVTGTVIYKVTGVSLSATSLTLTEKETTTLTATVEPAEATNQKVTWSSNAPGVATVDADGRVTAVDAGTATITVTTEDGNKTATCTVTVEHDPAGTWSSDADGHWHACAACGDRLDYAGHTRTVDNEKKATCTEDGYTGDTVCSVCGYVIKKGTAIPATGHSYQDGICTACGAKEPTKDEKTIPATGDVAPLACALAGISGMALVAAGLRKKTSR